ncbi:MAG: UDP-N-acetylglucosamine--LPS N-acetylglucosamine transferase, partial [Actinocatenispora sp.]
MSAPAAPALPTRRGPGSTVAVVSASIGGGHNAAANELARRLTADGYTVDIHEFLDMFPWRIGTLARRAYSLQLEHAPGSWGWLCAALRWRPLITVIAVLTTALTGRAMRAAASTASTVVSTYPGASQVLARMRRRGRIGVPVSSYLTDVAVHPLWIAPGIDTYLAAHQVTADEAADLGATDVRLVDPAVRPAFRSGTGMPTPAARREFGLPATGRLALVVGGAWGVGDVERTARDVAASGCATPVVVCAANTALRHTLTEAGIGVAFGWVEDMAALMMACDVVVTNGGGVTSIEAMQLGVPVLIYRELPGHGRDNALTFHRAGLAHWVRGTDELAAALAADRPSAVPA